ncbi:MAG: hypothetical protein N3A57_07235, partial [Negativicutes bacterium]|nr:hypothetical protein [Negativicutes bacterium]
MNNDNCCADPGSIGFFGFAIACALTGATLLKLIPESSLIIAAGLCFGGIAQFYAAHIYCVS